MRCRDHGDMRRMRQGIPRGYTARQTHATARTVPAVSFTGQNGGESGTERCGDQVPLDPDASIEALECGNSSNDPRIDTHVLHSGGMHMGQRRSKLDGHAAELLALRRAGASIAQLTR